MKKYQLTDESISHQRHTLYRIKALKDLINIKAGDLGGFIESENNLSQEDYCWVKDNAKVYGDARVYENALIMNDASIHGRAQIFGNSKVLHQADVSDDAKIYQNAKIGQDAVVYGNALVYNEANILYGFLTTDYKQNLKQNIFMQTNIISQDDHIIAYKRVHADLTSEYDPYFKYQINEWAEAKEAEISDTSCAPGLHVSHPSYYPLYSSDNIILECIVMLDDIITVQQGKIRCKKLFVKRAVTF